MFSIITPVKNGSKYSRRFVQCLKRQTFKDWESIIVVDLSTDNSFETLQNLTKDDKRFKIFLNQESTSINGPYMARNIGLRESTYDWITFLDIDDLWFEDKLSLYSKKIKKNKNLKIIYSNYFIYNESSKKISRSSILNFYNPKQYIKIANPIGMLTSCVNKEAINKKVFKPINHEDYFFWIEIISSLKKENILYFTKYTGVYTKQRRSISSNKFKTILWTINCYKLNGSNYLIIIIKSFLRFLILILNYLISLLQLLSKPIKDYEKKLIYSLFN